MGKTSEIAASMQFIDEELTKESQIVEEKLAEETVEKKPFKMNDYIKPQIIKSDDIQKESSVIDTIEGKEKVKDNINKIANVLLEEVGFTKEAANKTKTKTKKEELDNKTLVGAGVAGSGATLAKHTYDRGNLTGRETLYHNTRKENIKNIQKEGLKGQFATDKNKAFTPDVLNHIDESELKGKVYLGRKRAVAESVGKNAKNIDALNGKGLHERKTLKTKVPTWKMKEVDNPELLDAKNGKEYIDKLLKTKGFVDDNGLKSLNKNPVMSKVKNMAGNSMYKQLGRKGTAVIQGDIDSKYIKGHKGYQKASMKEVGDFIKHNPKRFAKGLGQAGAGVALAGLGGKIIYDAQKQKKSQKIANLMLEEAGFIKEASLSDIKEKGKDVAYRILNGKPYMVVKDKVTNELEDGRIVKKDSVKKFYKNGKKREYTKYYDSDVHIGQKNINDIKKMVGKNPKKAAAVLGVTAAGIGGMAAYNKSKKKVEKIANELLKEAGFTK